MGDIPTHITDEVIFYEEPKVLQHLDITEEKQNVVGLAAEPAIHTNEAVKTAPLSREIN